jgi:hypothetical protein
MPDLVAPRIGTGLPVTDPIEGSGVVFLAWGLWLYLAGLFAPLRSGGEV